MMSRSLKDCIKKLIPIIANEMRIRKRIKIYRSNDNAFYEFLTDKELRDYIIKYGLEFSVNSIIAEDYEILVRDIAAS